MENKDNDVELFLGAIIAIRDISYALASLGQYRSAFCIFLQSMTDIPLVIKSMDSLHDNNGDFICRADIALIRENLNTKKLSKSLKSKIEMLHIALIGYSVCINSREFREKIVKIYNSAISSPEIFYNLFKNIDYHKLNYPENALLIEKFLNSFYASGP